MTIKIIKTKEEILEERIEVLENLINNLSLEIKKNKKEIWNLKNSN